MQTAAAFQVLRYLNPRAPASGRWRKGLSVQRNARPGLPPQPPGARSWHRDAREQTGPNRARFCSCSLHPRSMAKGCRPRPLPAMRRLPRPLHRARTSGGRRQQENQTRQLESVVPRGTHPKTGPSEQMLREPTERQLCPLRSAGVMDKSKGNRISPVSRAGRTICIRSDWLFWKCSPIPR